MDIEQTNLQFWINKLNNNELFSLSRYGDGEWMCILWKTDSNINTKYDNKLHEGLIDGLLTKHDEKYLLASQHLRQFKKRKRNKKNTITMLDEIESWLLKNSSHIHWYNADVFHYSSMDGELFPLFESLKNKKVVVVGPPWLQSLPFIDHFIETPENNAYKEIENIKSKIKQYDNSVISLSVGPSSNILINELHDEMSKHSWLIDFGSVWDVYCGVKSRTYHDKKMDQGIINKNLYGA